MKLLIVWCVEEQMESVGRLLHETGIDHFNVMQATHYQRSKHCGALSWFGREATCAQTQALTLSSFTTEDLAHEAVKRIIRYNAENENLFPPRAYVINVEEFSQITE